MTPDQIVMFVVILASIWAVWRFGAPVFGLYALYHFAIGEPGFGTVAAVIAIFLGHANFWFDALTKNRRMLY